MSSAVRKFPTPAQAPEISPVPFQGTAFPLSNEGLTAVSELLGVGAAEIWTVVAVETSGCGFLPDRRPQILYERHTFHRLTQGRYDDGDISDPLPGGYRADGAHQYERLAKAVALDRMAALQSTSWGIAQIIGENYAKAGFTGIEDMVAGMCSSENRQLNAAGSFLAASGLQRALRAHDWSSFARGYNGPNYAVNRYDVRLRAEFQKYSSGGALPDLTVRAAQLYLTYLGFAPGRIDGFAGPRTFSALTEFQAKTGGVSNETINAETVLALADALERRQG